MDSPFLDYHFLVRESLKAVVKHSLKQIEFHGMVGSHHFYITFRTDHPHAKIPPRLKQTYPKELTIVLQHQFWDLSVDDYAFSISLSFDGIREMLIVPFDSLIEFADPSEDFVLQFEPSVADPIEEDVLDTSNVVSLDLFRKKE
jgi:uncharacterized protein